MSTPPLLLTVGSNKRNLELLAQFLGRLGYRSHAVSSLEALDRALCELEEIKLALVDISGFDRGIWKRCERLQEKDIPVLVISPKQSAVIRQQSLTHGARGLLVKPLVMRDLAGLIRNLLG